MMVRTNKKYILLVIVALIAIVAIYGYVEFNRKPASLLDAVPQVIANADSLVAAYENDEATANAKYLGKIVLVTGKIATLKNEQDTLLNIIIGDSNALQNVSCLLEKNELENFKKCSVGKAVSIKGICTGFLADVELNKCIIDINTLK
jgi:tRNA_anti-like